MSKSNTVSFKRWFILDDWIRDGGNVILGPFDTKELALRVRELYEQTHNTVDGMLFVDSEDVPYFWND